MHASCSSAECYGALFRRLTLQAVESRINCDHCQYVHEATQQQCIMRVEPLGNVESSICSSLQEQRAPEFECEACGRQGARSQRTLGEMPPVLVVHVNKEAGVCGIPSEAAVRLSGQGLRQVRRCEPYGRDPVL